MLHVLCWIKKLLNNADTYTYFYSHFVDHIRTVTGLFCILWRGKITFLIFVIQQIVQSLVNQLGVDSAQANISTTSSVSTLTMDEIKMAHCLHFGIPDTLHALFVSEYSHVQL